jgi:hypothetical protein
MNNEECPCGRSRVGCEYHDPNLQPVKYDTEQQPLRYSHVAAWPDGSFTSHPEESRLAKARSAESHGLIPLDLAEEDARIAAACLDSAFSWCCLECKYKWGTASKLVYADKAWCPACQLRAHIEAKVHEAFESAGLVRVDAHPATPEDKAARRVIFTVTLPSAIQDVCVKGKIEI